MTMPNDTAYARTSADYVGGPLFSGIDFMGGIAVLIMILGPLTAAATHASHMGW